MNRYSGMAGQKALKGPTAKISASQPPPPTHKKAIIVWCSKTQLIENKASSHWTPVSSNERYEKQPRDAEEEAAASNEYH
ncbi:hypothetical protein DNTS_014453 [Danionella cerebrum]|uniref:Uncharacterized protein n=1 Tax=Danionella cerebrum TaxID=2873325 RepID=A0A553QMI6_9TELE|nr:hypothetical protein DNTS_014453 [Danionella translucida]